MANDSAVERVLAGNVNTWCIRAFDSYTGGFTYRMAEDALDACLEWHLVKYKLERYARIIVGPYMEWDWQNGWNHDLN